MRLRLKSVFTWTVFGWAFLAAAALPLRATAACQLGKLAELPVTMVNMQPLVSAKINGADVRFVADTGAFFSGITPGNAADLALPLHAAPFGLYVEGVGGSATVSVATVKTLTLAGQDLRQIDFIVGGSEVGASNVGLLGENVLGHVDGDYDLGAGMITLMKPMGCSDYSLAYWDKAKQASAITLEIPDGWRSFERLTPSPVGTAYVNGVRIRVIFDTGASASVLSLRAAGWAGVKPDSPGVTASGLSSGIGRGAVETWIAPFDSFKIGDEEIKHTKLRIGRIGIDGVDMMLGADFFLSHHVYVANSQHKIYFTYNGGPVFDLSASRPAAEPPALAAAAGPQGADEPKDAESYSRRGQARLQRHDLSGALADLDHAVSLAPAEPRYLQERAVAHVVNKQPLLARQDLDQAVTLNADFVPARLDRGEMRLQSHDEVGALADLDAVDRLSAKAADIRLTLGQLYSELNRYDRAVMQLDLWIKAHPVDSRQFIALNGRCWARGQLGEALQQALSDCNAALRLKRAAGTLDSRGLVELRLGAYDKAITDYDAALALEPKMAWSLYGRGLAKIRTGHATEGQADMAAASALDGTLPAVAKARGLFPTP